MLIRRLILAVAGFVVIAACVPKNATFYGSASSFAVWSIALDGVGSGSVEVTYVNPGDPTVKKRSLSIRNAKAGRTAELLRGGIRCGDLPVHFEQDGLILVLGEGANVHVFSKTNRQGIEGNLSELKKTAALQFRGGQRTSYKATTSLLAGC